MAFAHWRTQQSLAVPALKGDVEQSKTWHSSLGEPHPFDYKLTKGLYLKMSFVQGVIGKIVDWVWGPGFYTKSMNENAKKIIDQWLDDVDFELVGRKWLQQAVIKGFSPLELGGSKAEMPQGVKVLNADRVFVKRNEKGVVVEFNQVQAGKMITYDNATHFLPFEIAALHLNQLDDDAYGHGMIYPHQNTLNDLLEVQKDLHTLIRRKANNPMVATLGDRTQNEIPTPEAVADFGEKLAFMCSRTEFAVSDNVRLSMVDFGQIGQKFDVILQNDTDMLFFGFQIPEAIMGRGNIAEGLGQENREALDRYVKSIQLEVESVIETQIFKRILLANNISAKVEFEWGQPSLAQKNTTITQITALLGNTMLSNMFRFELEKKLAPIFDIDESKIVDPATEAQGEAQQPQPKVPKQQQFQTQFYEGEWLRTAV